MYLYACICMYIIMNTQVNEDLTYDEGAEDIDMAYSYVAPAAPATPSALNSTATGNIMVWGCPKKT